jgi:hypothetical protein
MTESTTKSQADKLVEQYCVELGQLKYGRATIGAGRRRRHTARTTWTNIAAAFTFIG